MISLTNRRWSVWARAEAAGLALFPTPDSLPADAAYLFEAAEQSFFCSREWYRTILHHALPAGSTPLFALCRIDGRAAAIFPLLLENGRELKSLTTLYTCLWRPLLADQLSADLLRSAGAALGRFCAGWPVVRLDALEADWPGLALILAGVRTAGLAVQPFDHFGNWYEPVRSFVWSQYLQSRPSALRQTIRRKLKRAERETFVVLRRPEDLPAGIAAYEGVYQRSWKTVEPFPEFNAALMRAAAQLGILRLGVLHADGKAIAVQFWILANGSAGLLKLAHDEAFRLLSPGTVLTALMIREFIESERVCELDFGCGDDAYKRLWASKRRQRIGILVINPRRLQGMAALGWQWLGRRRRQVLGRLGRRPS